MSVLVDSAVWVDYLNLGTRGPARHLDSLLEGGEVVTCGPVVAELLAGAQQPERSELWALFEGLPWVDLGRDLWKRVGETAGTLRHMGMLLPWTDVEIAVAAVASDAQVWTRDAHFERLTRVIPLALYLPSG